LGDRIIFDEWEDSTPTRFQHTNFSRSTEDNYFLRDILPSWDQVLTQKVFDPVIKGAYLAAAELASTLAAHVLRLRSDFLVNRSAVWLAPTPTPTSAMGAYQAVRFIERSMGIPVGDVLASAGINRRTFYNWQESGVRQPRLTSEGRLWKLSQLTQDLTTLLGDNLPQWMRIRPERREWLREGKYDELLASVMMERSRSNQFRRQFTAGPSTAVGPEPNLPRMSPRRVPRQRTARGTHGPELSDTEHKNDGA
jgi:hypothetical protein